MHEERERAGWCTTSLSVDHPDGRSTTSYTLRDDAPDPRGSPRSVSGNRRRSRGTLSLSLSLRFYARRLPSTFVASAAFIDGRKSVVRSSAADSKISIEKPEGRCHGLKPETVELGTRHTENFAVEEN